MLQCMTSEFDVGNWPACGKKGLGTAAFGVPGASHSRIASTSTLIGYPATRSISERFGSRAPRRVAPGLSSVGGAVKSRVTSATAALSGP